MAITVDTQSVPPTITTVYADGYAKRTEMTFVLAHTGMTENNVFYLIKSYRRRAKIWMAAARQSNDPQQAVHDVYEALMACRHEYPSDEALKILSVLDSHKSYVKEARLIARGISEWGKLCTKYGYTL